MGWGVREQVLTSQPGAMASQGHTIVAFRGAGAVRRRSRHYISGIGFQAQQHLGPQVTPRSPVASTAGALRHEGIGLICSVHGLGLGNWSWPDLASGRPRWMVIRWSASFPVVWHGLGFRPPLLPPPALPVLARHDATGYDGGGPQGSARRPVMRRQNFPATRAKTREMTSGA
jgi:hypothetical protein